MKPETVKALLELADTAKRVFDLLTEALCEYAEEIQRFWRVIVRVYNTKRQKWPRCHGTVPVRPLLLDRRERIHRCRNNC